jgi:LacI family transcriptional regulator
VTEQQEGRDQAQPEHAEQEQAEQDQPDRSPVVAYIGVDPWGHSFVGMVAGIEAAASDRGALVYLGTSSGSRDRESWYLDLMLQCAIEGILITPVAGVSEELSRANLAGTPVVLIDPAEDGHPFCSTIVDDTRGGEIGALHLIETGHRRIAYLGGPATSRRTGEQLAGAQRAARDCGDESVWLGTIPTDDGSFESGRRAAHSWAEQGGDRPTAVICGDGEELTLGFLTAVRELGLGVPGDVAIVGLGDDENLGAAGITSVRPPHQALGATAVELLFAEASAGAGHVHSVVAIPPVLVARASTAQQPLPRALARRGIGTVVNCPKVSGTGHSTWCTRVTGKSDGPRLIRFSGGTHPRRPPGPDLGSTV